MLRVAQHLNCVEEGAPRKPAQPLPRSDQADRDGVSPGPEHPFEIRLLKIMMFKEDYQLLVRGLSELDFTGSSIPCKLILTGDTAFPVMVSSSGDVLVAASRYGKGRLVVVSHEHYLNNPNLMGFLQNAVSWLKLSEEAVIGLQSGLDLLSKTLQDSGCKVKSFSYHTQGLGVVCTDGYDDSKAKELMSFLYEGGGLLVGAQAWYWAYSHANQNVFVDFPGNKIVSVSGIYFHNSYGDRGIYSVSKDIPHSPVYTDYNFSSELVDLLKGVSVLDISGSSSPSELLVHGPLGFPIGLTDDNCCFLAATIYGRGRVVVVSHESLLAYPALKTVMLNAISWLDYGKKGKIGVNKTLGDFNKLLRKEGLDSNVSNLVSGLSVYCCNSYDASEAEGIKRFVAEGGSLLIAGQAWNWSYKNPDKNVFSHYPGNKILNTFGISIKDKIISQGAYKSKNPEDAANIYNFPRAFCQLAKALKNEEELKPPLSSWVKSIGEDATSLMKLPPCPVINSLQQECVCLVKQCTIPKIGEDCPVKNHSKDSLILGFVQDTCSFSQVDNIDDSCVQDKTSVTIEIDATNPGENAWRSTGLYLPPKKTAALVFPAIIAGKCFKVQIGCQSDNLSSAELLYRPPVVVIDTYVPEKKVLISCAWGGLVYIIVPAKSDLGIIPVTVYGAEMAPTYVKGMTCISSWVKNIRALPAPWAELVTENIILTVPSAAIRSLDDPEELLSLWDKIMEAVADLAAIPKKFQRPERIVADVQISAGWMHAGYPVMCYFASTKDLVNLQKMTKDGLWGPIHELGHNQQKGAWEFPPHTTEATCNLWSVYVHETVMNIPRYVAHEALRPEARNDAVELNLEKGAKLEDWSVWTALETYLQLQEGFGWDPFKRLFADYQTMSNIPDDNPGKMNLWAMKFSQAVNRNLVHFFKDWGWPINDDTVTKLSGLPDWEQNPMTVYVDRLRK
uniref:Peptidase M60 domain-containing protein n=2 Tax=Leptobrachium leishanense TaxID=445787 RepID=A0A8C5PEC3_9ANUR